MLKRFFMQINDSSWAAHVKKLMLTALAGLLLCCFDGVGVEMKLAGQIGGGTYALTFQDDHVFLGVGPRVFILDVSDPNNPTLIGKTGILPSIVKDIVVVGNYAYIANDYGGLHIVDVSVPNQPYEIGSYVPSIEPIGPTPKFVDVAVVENFVFIVDWGFGLRIIDVSNISEPHEVGSFETGQARRVAVMGNYAFLVGHDFDLWIINISDPTNPFVVSSYDTAEHAWSIAVAGHYVYLGGWETSLRIIDVSDPTRPYEVGSFDTRWGAHDLVVLGNYAYISSDGLWIVDISDPTNPVGKGFYYVQDVWSIAVEGDLAYITGESGLRIIEVSDPSSPTEVGFYDVPGYINVVAIKDLHVFIPDRYCFYIFKVSATNGLIDIEKVGSFNIGAIGCYIAGEHAYLASRWDGLFILNISNLAEPTLISSWDTQHYTADVVVEENYAYIADDKGGLRIIDVSNPANPIEVGAYDTPGYARGVTLAGDYAFVADGDKGLRIISVSNPLSPQEVGFYETPGHAYDVVVRKNYAYVAAMLGGLRIIDVSDPVLPQEVGFCSVPGYAVGVEVAGNYAYVAASDAGLVIVRFDGLEHYGCIHGKVTDAATGDGIAGALVEAQGPLVGPQTQELVGAQAPFSTVTDEFGNYTLELPEGVYDMRASAEGYEPQVKGVTVIAGETVELNFELTPTAPVNRPPIARATDIVGQPETMYPDTAYTVTAKYFDPDGREDLKYCYLRLNHPEKPLTMMWYQEDGHAAPWAGEEGENYLTKVEATATEIVDPETGYEGYEIAWTFEINEDWPEAENAIDFGVCAIDDSDASSGWDYDDANVSFKRNRPPNPPEHLCQCLPDGTEIPMGERVAMDTVVFKGVLTDPDGDMVKLEVELRRLDELDGGFDETQGGLKESGLVSSGSDASCTAYGLIPAHYHWRARAVDEHGEASSWVEFGDNLTSEPDFTSLPESGYLPVLLIHGFQLTSNYDPKKLWKDMAEHLSGKSIDSIETVTTDSGHTFWRLEADDTGHFTIYISNYGEGTRTWDDIRLYAKRLADEIVYMKWREGVALVDLVGHSMGGLVARAYIESADFEPYIGIEGFPDYGVIYHHDVRKLITLGTPHHGADLADLAHCFTVTVDQFTNVTSAYQMETGSSFLNILNYGNPHGGGRDLLNNEVEYVTIAAAICLDCYLQTGIYPIIMLETCLQQCIAKAKKWDGFDGLVSMQSASLDNMQSHAIIVLDHFSLRKHWLAQFSVYRLLRDLPLAEILLTPDAVTIACPVHVTIIDQYGRRLTDTGIEEIPGASVHRDEENDITTFYLNPELVYTVNIEAYESGTFSLAEIVRTEDAALTLSLFANVPVTESSRGEISVTPGELDRALLLDHDGDGSVDEEREPVTTQFTECVEERHELADAGWHMMALPGELCIPCTYDGCGDIACALCDDLEGCFIFYWNPDARHYVMAPPPENICYHQGMGFWARTYEPDVEVDAEVMVPTGPVEVPLKDGWNMIGDPFPLDVPLSSLKVRHGEQELSLLDAQQQGWVSAYLFGYNPEQRTYVMLDPANGVLEAWHGYWMRAYVDCTLVIPPEGTGEPVPAAHVASLPSRKQMELPPPPSLPPLSAQLRVVPIPNPVRDVHTTTFRVLGIRPACVEGLRVEIFDLAGRLVWRGEVKGPFLEWYIRGLDGLPLANGVYPYKAYVKVDGEWIPTGVGKVVILR